MVGKKQYVYILRGTIPIVLWLVDVGLCKEGESMLIKDVFAGFLKEQKGKVSLRAYKEYKDVIEFFEDSLDGYAWNTLDDSDKAYKDAQLKKLTFKDIYDHTYIWDNVGEFLDYFIPKKVRWGDTFVLKTCPKVVRALLKWMRDNKLLDKSDEEIMEACENQTWEDSLKEMGF